MAVAAVYATCFGRKRSGKGRWGLDQGSRSKMHSIRMDQHLKDMMPNESEAIRTSWLGKLSAESSWTDRRAVLTSEILAFSRRHEDRMCDSIPLHEIELDSIRRLEGDVLRQPGTATMIPPSTKSGIARSPSNQASPMSQGPTPKLGSAMGAAAGKATNALQRVGSTGRRTSRDRGARGGIGRHLDDDTSGELGAAPPEPLFELRTIEGGVNSGRMYVLLAETMEECEEWVADLKAAVKVAIRIEANQTLFREWQQYVRAIYTSTPCQVLVAILIFGNFAANAAQFQLVPEENTSEQRLFFIIDLIFSVLFTIELAVNLFAHWLTPFISDGWNVFDFIVVLVSDIAYAVPELPGVNVLRLVRAFRVLRLFGRLKELRGIINALTASLIPVFNALMIVLLVTAIYAILGVLSWKDRSEVRFGTFSAAMYTMFQVITMEGWSSEIARPMFDPSVGPLDTGVAVYFASFVVIVGWILLPVVMAVLLDNFVQAAADDERKAQLKKEKAIRFSVDPIAPLLASLSYYDTGEDLSSRVRMLFEALDVDMVGKLGFQQLHENLKQLNFNPRIHLSEEDYEDMLKNAGMDEYVHEDIGIVEFEELLRSELARHVQRSLAKKVMGMDPEHDDGHPKMLAIKLLHQMIDESTDKLDELESALNAAAALPTNASLTRRQLVKRASRMMLKEQFRHAWMESTQVSSAHRNGLDKSTSFFSNMKFRQSQKLKDRSNSGKGGSYSGGSDKGTSLTGSLLGSGVRQLRDPSESSFDDGKGTPSQKVGPGLDVLEAAEEGERRAGGVGFPTASA